MDQKTFSMSMVLLIILFAVVNPLFGEDNPNPPASAVKLIFIHHSTGGHWLADSNEDQPYGGLGIALQNNNYFVSATNYGWGPDTIGDRTDIINWPEWFKGPNSSTILNALYTEEGQNFGDFGSWSRLSTNPGGENQVIMFKSCFPNSDLYGNPNDPPLSEPNDNNTVSNAKAVYNNLLTYFQTRQDKLFIVSTAPPQNESGYSSGDQTPAERAANARSFNNWLINEWLTFYPHKNVGVFDYFNALTGTENHHRLHNGAVQHVISNNNNFAFYPSGDSHPNTEGQSKATSEFVPLLNIFYNRWKMGAATVSKPSVSTGSSSDITSSSVTLNGTVNPNGASAAYYFEYGTTISYGSTTSSMSAGSGTADVSVNANLTGLKGNTTYHYRLVAINDAGTAQALANNPYEYLTVFEYSPI